MKQILVPTDFSTCAGNAVDFAVQSAKMLPVEVTLLHVVETPGDMYTDSKGAIKELDQSILNEVSDKLSLLKKSIEDTEGVKVNTTIYKGSVINAILHFSKEKDIELIVIGTLGASGLKEKLWGSKTAAVIGKSNVPVMVIPFFYSWKRPEKFLLATNHFEEEPAILNFLFELAELYQAKVDAAVFTDEDDDKAITFLEHTREIPKYEKKLKEKYREENLTVSHIFGNEFEKSLEDHIAQNKIDVLVMITYQRNFWERIFNPSMTKQMAYHTKIPLLAIPAKKKLNQDSNE